MKTVLDILQGVSDASVNVGDAVQAVLLVLGGILGHKKHVEKKAAKAALGGGS